MKALLRHRALVAGGLVALLLGALIAVLATRPDSGGIAASGLGGKPAPPITGENVLGGPPVSLTRLESGHFVVVDFFASWCTACLNEAPQLEALAYDRHGPAKVAVLGVDIEDSAANAARFLKQTGETFPAVADDGSIAEAYGVTSPPVAVVVDPAGRVVGVSTNATAAGVEALISAVGSRTT